MVAGYMNLTYLSSYVYVVTDLNTVHWNCEQSYLPYLCHRDDN